MKKFSNINESVVGSDIESKIRKSKALKEFKESMNHCVSKLQESIEKEIDIDLGDTDHNRALETSMIETLNKLLYK